MFGLSSPHRYGTFACLWEATISPLLEAAGARTVAEIGSDTGDLTRLLAAFCEERGGGVHVIDPSPSYNPSKMAWELGETFVFHQTASVEVLPTLPALDAILIDGDHNWHTVKQELKLLAERSHNPEEFPLVILHDTGWPYGRRDMYHVPERIPETERQPYDKIGMMPHRSHLKYGGYNMQFYNARHEGGPRNGVHTAIEDFLKESPYPLIFLHLPGIHGMGILVSEARLHALPALAALLETLKPSAALKRHMDALESDRLLLATLLQERERMFPPLHAENQRLRHLMTELLAASHQLKHLQQTKSWRITAPLRALEKRLRRRS